MWLRLDHRYILHKKNPGSRPNSLLTNRMIMLASGTFRESYITISLDNFTLYYKELDSPTTRQIKEMLPHRDTAFDLQRYSSEHNFVARIH
jgi:hypothetical protein